MKQTSHRENRSTTSKNNKKGHTDKPKVTRLKVAENAELMKFLIASMPGKSRNTIKSILAHKQVFVENKAITQFNHSLKAGQEVVIDWSHQKVVPRYQGLQIVFEDEYLIVIEKQAGLLSIATDNKDSDKTAYNTLSEHVKKEDEDNKIFVVHRLDKDTSGLMMFAKSKEIQQLLQKEWKDTVTERKYVAVVEGKVEKSKDTITTWLKESKSTVVYSSNIPDDGQKAVTHYEVIRKNEDFSMLEAVLETGRKNQIRVHMQVLKHSIVGDKKYGAKSNPIARIGLHARVLAFTHPITKEQHRFETPIPSKFQHLFKK